MKRVMEFILLWFAASITVAVPVVLGLHILAGGFVLSAYIRCPVNSHIYSHAAKLIF